MMIRESLLRTVSIGIVAKDIIEDDVYIEVYPIELHPNADGELTIENKHNNTVTRSDGTVKVINATQSNLITAKWLPDGDTNRLEPPTVCKNETVRLYRYSDTDKYYWNTLYNQLDKRKLEKRTMVVSNKASINIPAEQLLEYSYYMTTDTINKLVHLHTSTTDGEYTTYDIAIDTAEGLLELTDGKGNTFLLDSQADKFTFTTNKDIETNTVTKVNNATTKNDNILGRYDIKLKSYSVDNGKDELIQVLMDFAQACSDDIGEGNLGLPVPRDSATKSAYAALKARLQGFQ